MTLDEDWDTNNRHTRSATVFASLEALVCYTIRQDGILPVLTGPISLYFSRRWSPTMDSDEDIVP
jgi:hypothetical protein